MRARLIFLGALWAAAGCGKSECRSNCVSPTTVPGNMQPAGGDGSGTPTGSTTGTVADAGVAVDQGQGGGADLAGGCCDMASNPAGPWPLSDTVYGASQGLSGPILDSSPDDAQNIWAATREALYVMRPGQSSFQKLTAADGLHIGPFTDPSGHANETSITAIAGGHANEVFVGYYGYESDTPYQDTEAQKELGNADKVTLGADGRITVTRYLFRCDYEHSTCWENRSPRRMVFAHDGVAAGHLFIGFNHGVSHVFNDMFGDHVHPEVWWHHADGTTVEKIGEFFGLAVDAKGNLWMAGRYGVGLQPWNAMPHFSWVDGSFIWAFTIFAPGHSLDTPDNYVEDDSGAAITPSGDLYVSSFTRGLTHWDPKTSNYGTMSQVSAAPSSILDLAADPDGTLWMIDVGGQLLRYDPASNGLKSWPGISGAHRVVVDHTVTPRAVYVATDGGVAVIRAK